MSAEELSVTALIAFDSDICRGESAVSKWDGRYLAYLDVQAHRARGINRLRGFRCAISIVGQRVGDVAQAQIVKDCICAGARHIVSTQRTMHGSMHASISRRCGLCTLVCFAHIAGHRSAMNHLLSKKTDST